ncbi:hypothetical protein [Pseudokordiimonas caeni]|uniref:hypothetical protein n=1 Tax=Pseudokordiimonas caeni TaxID=2997908 RepID=UPI002811ECFC|nr:hypothetical protein [Pseudokordiimonas caeni]
MSRYLQLICAGICSLTLRSADIAASDEITISSEVTPTFMGGEFRGCSVNFEAARRDAEYGSGKLAYISGSINVYALPEKVPAVMLKLGIRYEDDPVRYLAPSELYLINGYKTNKSEFVRTMDAEQTGFKLSVYEFGNETIAALIEPVISEAQITVGYTLDDGQLLAKFPIDLRMRNLNFSKAEESTIDEQAPRTWLNCLNELFSVAMRDLSGQ